MNVGTGIDIIHDDEEIVEKKIELLDIPEHNLDEGGVGGSPLLKPYEFLVLHSVYVQNKSRQS